GAYVLTLPVGTHTISVSAPGYVSQSVENVVISHDQHVILQFVLAKDTHNNDPCIPVTATALHQNYPNPFNPETTISYSVKEPGRVRLEVYNIKGQRVKTLVDADHSTGHYRLIFNAKDTGGRSLGSGVYLLRMIAPGYRKTTRMVLMQ
ncbi:MAG: T9SS type A sorting domain-containing protein, partial [Candidatus Cloacimonadaceae bacterium]